MDVRKNAEETDRFTAGIISIQKHSESAKVDICFLYVQSLHSRSKKELERDGGRGRIGEAQRK
jgi:hypothetical protein